MRLLFKKDGEEILIERNLSAQVMTMIRADTHMATQAMMGGIPVIADGGEYTLVEEDYEPKQYRCELCKDTGELDADETDADGNIARGTLTEKCACRLSDNDESEHE